MEDIRQKYIEKYPVLERVLNVFFDPIYSGGQPVELANALDFKYHEMAVPMEVFTDHFNQTERRTTVQDLGAFSLDDRINLSLEYAVNQWVQRPAFLLAEYYTTMYPALQSLVARFYWYGAANTYSHPALWNRVKWNYQKCEAGIRAYFEANPEAMEDIYTYCKDRPGDEKEFKKYFGKVFELAAFKRAETPFITLEAFLQSRAEREGEPSFFEQVDAAFEELKDKSEKRWSAKPGYTMTPEELASGSDFRFTRFLDVDNIHGAAAAGKKPARTDLAELLEDVHLPEKITINKLSDTGEIIDSFQIEQGANSSESGYQRAPDRHWTIAPGLSTAYEMIKIIQALDLGFEAGEVFKLVGRAAKNPGTELQDLQEALYYLQHLIRRVEAKRVANLTSK